MMVLPESFRRHSVQLERLQAQGRYGPSYDPPVVVPNCWAQASRNLVTSSTGEQIIEAGRVFLGLDAPAIAPGDRLTLPDGHTGYAIEVQVYDSPGTLQHAEVSVT